MCITELNIGVVLYRKGVLLYMKLLKRIYWKIITVKGILIRVYRLLKW